MQTIRKVFLFISLLTGLSVFGQDQTVILDYIKTYKELAMQEMQRTGVPAAIKLAQGIHETSAGTSKLVTKSNNHFGIKCKDTWKGPSVSHTDDAPNECFRKYEQSADSYRDHSDFLKGSARYASLFKLDPLDYQGWAYGLKKAGYATNPRYPQVIIKLIEDYQLQDYTLIAMNKHPMTDDLAKLKESITKDVIAAPAVYIQETKTEPVIIPVVSASWPSGEFRINETRVIFAKKGTAFLQIANDFNIPLQRIFEFNELPVSDLLEKDQLIYLQRKRKTGNEEYHTVKSGETLHDISQIQAIRMESLIEYNLLKPGAKPAAGEKLSLRTKIY